MGDVWRAIQRRVFREHERLLPEEFRGKLDDAGVLDELNRHSRRLGMKLWLDAESRASEERGFTFHDLWMFYCGSPSGKARASSRARADGADAMMTAGAAIIAAVAAMREMEEMDLGPPWYQDLAAERGDTVKVFTDRVMVIGDLQNAMKEYAEQLQRRAEKVPKSRRNRATMSQAVFIERWTALALERSGDPLSSVGARLFEIVFDVPMNEETFARRRRRRVRRDTGPKSHR